MKITFMGAAREVTGSCYLVETDEVKFLVDCGMFQGGKEADRKNHAALAFELDDIDFVLLTHAHIDHSGLLPRLVAMGVRGPIYTTSATVDLLGVMLPDSGHIQEKEAEWENKDRRKSQKGHSREIAPLYTVAQAETSLRKLKRIEYDTKIIPHESVHCCFRDAGHILGSAILEIWVTEKGVTKKLVFSGDLGQPGHPMMRKPTAIEEADYVIMESTYGNRLHKGMQDTLDELALAINDTMQRKHGNVIIPAFAVGRTQDILYLLLSLLHKGKIGNHIQIYVDSPMAVAATEITLKHFEVLNRQARDLLEWERVNHELPQIRFVEDVEDSIAINDIKHGAIIISASGMCDAGRIKHHLKYNLGRPECTIVITGFQAEGTLGRRIVDGAKTVRIFRETIPVRADVYTIGGLSAHADQRALLEWVGNFKKAPRTLFITHGEALTAEAFADMVRKQHSWDVVVPELHSTVELD